MTIVMQSSNARAEGHPKGPSGRKADTRARIIEAAASLFREHGIDAVGVDAVMHKAGLTHGGFYGHFASKEALVAEVSAQSLERAAAKWQEIGLGPDKAAALARIVDSYLSPEHVASAAMGCVLATIGPEVARREDARAAISASVETMIEALARCVPGQRREDALAALSTMVGAVLLARLAEDGRLATEILGAARSAVLKGNHPAERRSR
jgi:TetR/AcrR family transcriptional repressor of nem operon